ncbi:MAG: hypothetical protein V4539_01100 [Bacteroidota bacterium]
MKTIFLHDTNALRILAQDQYFASLIPLARELRMRESKKDAESHMNVLVTMELLRHMDETDPHYIACLRALILQNHLTRHSKPSGGESIDFIPPWNPLLTQHFFGKNSDFMKYYYRIVEIAAHAAENADTDDWKKDSKDIKIIGDQLLHDRTEIKNNFEDLIKYMNDGNVDWAFHEKDLPIRKKFVQEIKNGKMIFAMAMGMLRRAHAVLELPFVQPGLEQKMDKFLQYYLPMLQMSNLLMKKFIGGFPSLADPLNKAWNTLNDMQFLAGACYVAHRERDNDVRVVIVTDDKGIHEACLGTYMEQNVWTVKQYLAFVYN